MMKQVVFLKKLDKRAITPHYADEGCSGFDLHALEYTHIGPGEITLVPTGIALEIPKGFEVQVRPRSGLSLHGIIVVNSPGTIDSSYRGEVKVILSNINDMGYIIQAGDRIAQGVLAPVTQAHFEVVDQLSDTERGSGGLGSTGR